MLLEQVTGGNALYYHQDQLGSIRTLTDQSGAPVASYTYDPYGRLVASTGIVANSFRFAGEYTDAETGLQYLRARYYEPGTGQFLSRDPIEAVTREAHGYVGGSPLNATDPLGLQTHWVAEPKPAGMSMEEYNQYLSMLDFMNEQECLIADAQAQLARERAGQREVNHLNAKRDAHAYGRVASAQNASGPHGAGLIVDTLAAPDFGAEYLPGGAVAGVACTQAAPLGAQGGAYVGAMIPLPGAPAVGMVAGGLVMCVAAGVETYVSSSPVMIQQSPSGRGR